MAKGAGLAAAGLVGAALAAGVLLTADARATAETPGDVTMGEKPIGARPGWRVVPTGVGYGELLEALKAAVAAEGMAVVTEAGPTEAAAARGVTIPGNRVVGVFRNDFAVRALASSTAAMIEAPIRFYVTENPDGTATLAWKTPGFVFAPYLDEGGEALAALAGELDRIFEAIARRATGG